jgi:hypothetical protein
MTKYVAAFASLVLATGIAAAASTPAHGVDETMARLLGGDPCNHAAPRPSNPVAAPVRIGSYNIRAGTSTGDFSAGVHAFAPYADIIGLQETNSKDKAMVLANLASSGWDFYRQFRTDVTKHPHQGGTEQQPVLWQSDRFVCTYAGPALMSDIFSLRGEKPAFDDTRKYWFTVVHLVDRITGQKIAIVNVHLIPGVIMSGVPIKGIPRHWALYQKQLNHVVAMARQQQNWGRVFVLGDFNSGWLQDAAHRHKGLPIRTFHAIGFRSMWATENPGKGRGSHGKGLIDQVWSTGKATSAKVLFALNQYSDHKPVVARYHLAASS